MKAQELRIGNLVNHTTGQCKVVGFYGEIFRAENINKIELKSNVFNLQPIPLTEEWLLKFGFSHCENYSWYEKKLPNLNIVISCNLHGDFCIENKNDIITIKDRCYNLHQLQNLYFALTGEELILNT